MYLLRIDHPNGPLVQGIVRTEWPAGNAVAALKTGAWARLFARSTQLWAQLQALSCALRVSLAAGNGLSTVHSFVVDATQEQSLRAVLAAFLRTDQLASGRTEVPLSAENLEGTFLHSGSHRFRLEKEPLSTPDGLKISHNLRIAHHLPRLLTTAADMGLSAAYEMQVAPWKPTRELSRDVLINASRLRESSAMPRDLLGDQLLLADRLRQSDYQIEEGLASDDPASLEGFANALTNLLGGSIYARFGITPKFAIPDEISGQAFGYHVHSSLVGEHEEGRFEQLSSAVTRGDIDEILGCTSLGLAEASSRSQGGPSEPLFSQLSSPAASGTNGGSPFSTNGKADNPYLFVSYARADSDLVLPIVERLVDSGVELWIDKEIPTGNDWVNELEARLVGCSGVIAFVSPAYAESKNCGREIRVADALNRSIFPVVIKSADLFGSGLGFLLNNIQRVEASQPTVVSDIVKAVRRAAPEAARTGLSS